MWWHDKILSFLASLKAFTSILVDNFLFKLSLYFQSVQEGVFICLNLAILLGFLCLLACLLVCLGEMETPSENFWVGVELWITVWESYWSLFFLVLLGKLSLLRNSWKLGRVTFPLTRMWPLWMEADRLHATLLLFYLLLGLGYVCNEQSQDRTAFGKNKNIQDDTNQDSVRCPLAPVWFGPPYILWDFRNRHIACSLWFTMTWEITAWK